MKGVEFARLFFIEEEYDAPKNRVIFYYYKFTFTIALRCRGGMGHVGGRSLVSDETRLFDECAVHIAEHLGSDHVSVCDMVCRLNPLRHRTQKNRSF